MTLPQSSLCFIYPHDKFGIEIYNRDDKADQLGFYQSIWIVRRKDELLLRTDISFGSHLARPFCDFLQEIGKFPVELLWEGTVFFQAIPTPEGILLQDDCSFKEILALDDIYDLIRAMHDALCWLRANCCKNQFGYYRSDYINSNILTKNSNKPLNKNSHNDNIVTEKKYINADRQTQYSLGREERDINQEKEWQCRLDVLTIEDQIKNIKIDTKYQVDELSKKKQDLEWEWRVYEAGTDESSAIHAKVREINDMIYDVHQSAQNRMEELMEKIRNLERGY